MNTERPAPGLIDSLRAALATLVELLRARVELITTEIEEQLHLIALTLLWGVVAVFAGGLAVLLLALTIVIAFWDSHRVLAAALVTALLASVSAGAAWVVRRRLRERPPLLSASTAELRRDASALRGGE